MDRTITKSLRLMDAETVRNTLIKLGRKDFQRAVSVVLRGVFGLNAVNVDGAYDGGTDWSTFKTGGGTTTVSFQDTVRDRKWQEKAVEDARKAVRKRGATRYFFLSPRTYSPLALRQVEGEITKELRIPATCLGAREIAEFIVEAGLTKSFLDAIDAPLAVGIAARPDNREILLHAYSNLSPDKHKHQTEIYDESLLLAAKLDGALSRDGLVAATIALLNCPAERAEKLSARINVLLSRRHLYQIAGKKIIIDRAVSEEIDLSERLYLKEFATLQAAQTSLMATNFGLHWDQKDAERVSVFLSRLFVRSQLESVKSAGLIVSAPGLVKNLGDPEQDLRDYLCRVGVPASQVQEVLDELVQQAKDLPLIKKLTRAAVYVSLEGADPVSSAKAIGAPRWSDVNVMLDASAAIPYLCARLYRPASGTFFGATLKAIRQLAELGSHLRISWNYIDECASHLLRALQYESLREFERELQFSQNAYVANYYRLRREKVKVPPTLREYLRTFSPAIKRPDTNKERWIRAIMTDMQKLLKDYDVEFESGPGVPTAIRKTVEVGYAYRLNELKRKKATMLVRHDVDTLSHVKRQVAQKGEHWVFLTWDKVMISVGKQDLQCGWVVSPEVALDFIQPYKPLSEVDLCAVAHRVARLRERSGSLTAQIIDRVVEIGGDELQDWQLRNELSDFKDEILKKIDFSKPGYIDWTDAQTDKFLEKMGFDLERPEKTRRPKQKKIDLKKRLSGARLTGQQKRVKVD